MLKIRRSRDRLIFNMGIPIPRKTVFILRQGPGNKPDRSYRVYVVSCAGYDLNADDLTAMVRLRGDGLRLLQVPQCCISTLHEDYYTYDTDIDALAAEVGWDGAANPLGPDSIKRYRLTSIGNPIVEIRRSYDHLISTMGFPILVRWYLYIESGPWPVQMGPVKWQPYLELPSWYHIHHVIKSCLFNSFE